MRKLIEKYERTSIICDNPDCDFEIPYDEDIAIESFINIPCPKCGDNLLTFDDYLRYKTVIQTVDKINKWFSWLTLFIPKNRKMQKTQVNTHNEISFKTIDV